MTNDVSGNITVRDRADFIGPLYFGVAGQQTGQANFWNASSYLATTFQAGNATAALTYTWPTAGPAGNNYVLGSSTVGVLSWINAAGTYAPIGSAFVTIGTDATLTSERSLTGTANQIVVTDNGAGSTAVLSLSQSPTYSGTVQVDGRLIGKGVATNTAPAAGYIGETISSAVTNQSGPTSTQFGDLTSISLTAGNWNVEGVVLFVPNGATITQCGGGISTTTGNSGTGLVSGDTYLETTVPTGNSNTSITIPGIIASLSGTTIYYLKITETYSAGTPKYYGRITATRRP